MAKPTITAPTKNPFTIGLTQDNILGGDSSNEAELWTLATLRGKLLKNAIIVNRNGTNQTGVVTATPTKIAFTNEVLDGNSEYDNATNYRYTPQQAGYYLVFAQATTLASVDQTGYMLYVYKNGGVALRGPRFLASGTGAVGAFIFGLVSMNGSTDYIEFFYEHNAGSDRTLDGTSSRTFGLAFPIR